MQAISRYFICYSEKLKGYMFSMRMLEWYKRNIGMEHWKVAKKVLRYL